MFAGLGSAEGDGDLADFLDSVPGALGFFRIVGIVEHVDMHVTITDVTVVHQDDVVFTADALEFLNGLHEPAAGYDGVIGHFVRSQLEDRGIDAPADFPEGFFLFGAHAFQGPDRGGKVAGDLIDFNGQGFAAAIKTDEQDGIDLVGRPRNVAVLVHELHNALTNELKGAGKYAGSENTAYGLKGVFVGSKAGHDRGRGFRFWQELEKDFGNKAESAFGAHHEFRQIEADHILVGSSAEHDLVAAGKNHFRAKHEVARDAVLHGTHAAGAGDDIAAEAGGLYRGRIRRIIDALRLTGSLKAGRVDAGLDDAHEIPVIDFEDMIHL